MICTVLPGSVADGTPATGTPAAAVLTGPESGFHRLTPDLLALLEAGSMAGRIGYVEADYIGREGRQAAAVWEAGSMVVEPMLLGRNEPYSPGRAPISVALNRLGVAGSGRRDAFVIAGLGRHRRTAEWY